MYREKTGLNGPPVMWKCKNYSKYTYCTVVSILFFTILNDFFLQGLFFYGSACSKVSWGPYCNLLYFSLPLSNPSAQYELFIRTPFHNYKNEMSFLKILIDYSIISNWPVG